MPADLNRSGQDAFAGRTFRSAADGLIQVGMPAGTEREAEVAIARLIELTGILARRASQLQQALDSRIVIEQAKGILAERHGIGIEEAFHALRRGARSNRVQLHELAAHVVASPTTPREVRFPALDGR